MVEPVSSDADFRTMAELLTTRQLEEILKVDRTTIYRMADTGRIPAMKIGNQWRFPRQQVEAWLQNSSQALPFGDAAVVSAVEPSLRDVFPLECVQLIQDSFAEALGVMLVATDLEGRPVTHPSNPCQLYLATENAIEADLRCLGSATSLGRDPTLEPRFMRGRLGLLFARGLICIGTQIRGMLLLGGIAPVDWPPPADEVERMALDLGLASSVIQRSR